MNAPPAPGPAGQASPAAAPQPSLGPGATGSTEFTPVAGGDDTTSAEALLVTAYALLWALVFAFLLHGWRRHRALEARLEKLERALPPE